MVFAPPQHGKSELVSRRFPSYALGRNPNLRILGASYNGDLASAMNVDAQRVIDAPEYRRLFPGTRLWGAGSRVSGSIPYTRNSMQFEVVGHKGGYRCAGRGQGVAGRPAHVLIADDLIKDDEEAQSPAVREAAWNWFRTTYYPRLASDGVALVTTTRWHRKDVPGMLMALPTDQKWTVLMFPAVAADEPSPYDDRSAGEPLCPNRFNRTALADLEVTLGPTKWQAIYQQNPRPEGATEFSPNWFGDDIWFEQWPGNLAVRTMALDPSKGKSDRVGDPSAYVMLGMDPEGTLYCECNMSRRQIPQMVADGVGLYGTFRPDLFGVEANAFQELLAPEFGREFKTQEILAPNPLLINNSVNKLVRIRRLAGYLSQGRIKFKANSAGTRMLIDQLEDFPHADHDDGPDALEMAVRLMVGLVNGSEEEQPPNEETYEQVFA
jgi:predicted phage terminase large subunit-like protein